MSLFVRARALLIVTQIATRKQASVPVHAPPPPPALDAHPCCRCSMLPSLSPLYTARQRACPRLQELTCKRESCLPRMSSVQQQARSCHLLAPYCHELLYTTMHAEHTTFRWCTAHSALSCKSVVQLRLCRNGTAVCLLSLALLRCRSVCRAGAVFRPGGTRRRMLSTTGSPQVPCSMLRVPS